MCDTPPVSCNCSLLTFASSPTILFVRFGGLCRLVWRLWGIIDANWFLVCLWTCSDLSSRRRTVTRWQQSAHSCWGVWSCVFKTLSQLCWLRLSLGTDLVHWLRLCTTFFHDRWSLVPSCFSTTCLGVCRFISVLWGWGWTWAPLL